MAGVKKRFCKRGHDKNTLALTYIEKWQAKSVGVA
jgi:hypothetical protein